VIDPEPDRQAILLRYGDNLLRAGSPFSKDGDFEHLTHTVCRHQSVLEKRSMKASPTATPPDETDERGDMPADDSAAKGGTAGASTTPGRSPWAGKPAPAARKSPVPWQIFGRWKEP
jgi:hypothetical protein